jgi:hypothetical protein
MTTHNSLLALYLQRTGRTTHTMHQDTDTRQLSQYWRDRVDLSTVPDHRRWR